MVGGVIFDQIICYQKRSLHSPVDSIWNGQIPPPFHGLSINYFLAGSLLISPFHTHYGFHMESMEFPMNLNLKSMYFHKDFMDSMEQSIWIPWNSPHGFHGPFQWKA